MTIIGTIYLLFAGFMLHLASKNYGNSKAVLDRAKDNLKDSDDLKAKLLEEIESTRTSGRALIEKMAKSMASAMVHAEGGCDCEGGVHKDQEEKEAN